MTKPETSDVDPSEALDENVVNRFAIEDRDRDDLLKTIAPLASKLRPGPNFYTPQEFFGIVRFYAESITDVADALEIGRVELFGEFTLIRVQPVYLVTAAELAERSGVNRTTALRWLHTSKAPFSRRGKNKLYNITGLDLQLCRLGEVS